MDYNFIKTDIVEEKIAVITLNRPEKKNALSIQMRYEISDCLKKMESAREIGAVIITGSGSTFSAGFDLKEFSQPELFEEIYISSSRYHRDVWNFKKPAIAAIENQALGGGFDLATLCDIRICTENAVFGHPEIKFGAPPLFTPLRWIVGYGSARDLCLTGRIINSSAADKIGLVSEIVNIDIIERAVQIAKSILEAPMSTLITAKNYMNNNANLGFEESFVIEHDNLFISRINKLKNKC
ncbi:MAG TPA: enoyl-CoA hydratase/isomerase family protein [Spirochaetota bacterium]|nr:enoyl-CoA hydratase/isomerase family protein [Spirochaetota bacterium]